MFMERITILTGLACANACACNLGKNTHSRVSAFVCIYSPHTPVKPGVMSAAKFKPEVRGVAHAKKGEESKKRNKHAVRSTLRKHQTINHLE